MKYIYCIKTDTFLSMEILEKVLDRRATRHEIAQHIADCISAQERLRCIARREGCGDLIVLSNKRIKELRIEAKKYGLSRDEYPGLYR